MPDPDDLLPARLARMKALVEQLERACSESAEQREVFNRLRAELDATRRSLELHKP